MQDRTSEQISYSLDKPLSNVQRRIRQIQEKGIVTMKLQVDLSALGLKKGLLHVYLDDGEFFASAQSLSKLQGVQSAAVHIGNSDVVLEFLFRDSSKILRLIS